MIIHADMDAFYVSVELLDNPQLREQPVAVGGPSKSRGVISAANYIARQYGVHSALPTRTAVERCPNLVLLPPRISIYAEYSRKINQIFYRYTPTIEPLALDEAFLDPQGSEKLFGDAEYIGRQIKADIKAELGLVVSIGIASSKFVAKIASDIEKPDGFVVVAPDSTQAFLDPLPITRIWGIGKKSSALLHHHGIETIRQLRSTGLEKLRSLLGNHADRIHQLSNGIDNRRVVPDHEAKSISHEFTFERDLTGMDQVISQFMQLTESVSARMRHSNITGKTVTIKVRFSDFKTISRSHTMDQATNQTDAIWQVVSRILLSRVALDSKKIRLLGLGMSQLLPPDFAQRKQLGLFDQEMTGTSIDKLTDAINRRFGASTLTRGRNPKNLK